MKKIILLVISIIVLSCNSDKPKADSNLKDFRSFKIISANRVVELPNSYQEMSIEEYFSIIEETLDDESKKVKMYDKLHGLLLMGSEFQVFVDTHDYLNCITVMSSPFTVINKSIFTDYVEMLEQQMETRFEQTGDNTKMLEKKLLNYGNTKVIKIKIQHITANDVNYTSQYIITMGNKTFNIGVNNVENRDFNYLMDNFKS